MDGEYTILVIDSDGSEERKEFDNAEDYDFVFADYCGYGYYCRDFGNYAIVEWVGEVE